MDPHVHALRMSAYFGKRSVYYMRRQMVDMAVELAKAAWRWAEIAKGTQL